MMTFVWLLTLLLQEPAPKATAAISGRVTDAVSGAPISGAIVALGKDTARPTVTRANDVGEFSFTGLAAGAYHLAAAPPEHRASHLPTELVDRGKPGASLAIDLAAGEARHNVVIAMRRSLAISGRVVDEWGLPLGGIA
ncbi:MAG TPA: carboxypeptidase-like regulatory domain-containing protein, partial [Casimicrobiaceae bacterium]